MLIFNTTDENYPGITKYKNTDLILSNFLLELDTILNLRN